METNDLVPELEYAFEFAHKYFSADSVDAYLAVKICAALHEFSTQRIAAETKELKNRIVYLENLVKKYKGNDDGRL